MTQWTPNYPPELPVCEHREEILAALRTSRVVIVCGDTGSGKTTQLPKMALEVKEGRGKRDEGRGTKDEGRRIACTQPRRLAAVTMAERVAAELEVEVGGFVGYRHRFERKISSDTRIEFMTDGVLLAETRFDPLLRAYDTIIVDEAHERSLNIDFLLGILKRVLARRADLTVIVSSATLDAKRFSEFFDGAPVVSVPGRLYPIEIGYRPPPDGEELDLPRDVAAAVNELPPRDDILVFLPGERDIRETADYLTEVRGDGDEIIPLLASLPSAEQRRAFRTSSRRRIILATNVAETSVTIPGIRAVIDSGLARISRYVHRTQIQRLQIEPVSKASAKQRTGRCGRLGPGTCLRLYSQEDFDSRDDYTPPEVLRSSLAGVILTMLDLKLGDIEQFPFIDPPKPAMIREGLRELLELGALGRRGDEGRGTGEEDREIVLTDIGRKLAKIPVEPRLARMLLAGSENAVLPEVLPLVAAMACDDPRRRPMDERERADQAHARFRVAGSDFLGTLALWNWWNKEAANLSQSRARKLCQTTYLSYPKMREWRDLARQLESLAKRLGLSFAQTEKREDEDFSAALHCSLLTGLLGRIGKYDEEEQDYRGAHGLRFALHPSSVVAKQLRRAKSTNPNTQKTKEPKQPFPTWIVAGELVDTARLFARNAAAIDVRWIEPVAGAVCKHSYHSPEWDESSGFVRATEQVTLYGLVIVPARRCDYSRVDPVFSREIFIRRGLVDGDFPRPPPQVRSNQELLKALRRRAERERHPEFFDADNLAAHFAAVLPKEICSADALRTWLRAAPAAETAPFSLKKSDWWPTDAEAPAGFPDSLRIAGVTLALVYRHAPDDPGSDGITCTIRRSDVGVLRIWKSDWLVPGLLAEKLAWMINTLPTALRRVLSPIDETVSVLLPLLKPGTESLADAVRRTVSERYGVRIPDTAWERIEPPPHLQMRFEIRDDATGRTLAVTRDPDEALKLAAPAAKEPEASAPKLAQTWIFGDIPERSVDRNSGWETISYPGLHDEGEGVTLKLSDDPKKALSAHDAGVTRLFALALKNVAVPFRRNRLGFDAALYLKDVNYADDRVSADLLLGAVAETLVRNRPSVRTAAEFERRLGEDRAAVVRAQSEMSAILVESAAAATKIYGMMEDARVPAETAESVTEQIAWLLFPGFPRHVPLAMLRRYKRYLKGAAVRLERARLSPSSDLAKEEKFAPYWIRYREVVKKRAILDAQALEEFRWMLEEFRVSVFAQELRTPEPISAKRLDAKWERI